MRCVCFSSSNAHWPFNWLYLNRMFAFILSIISNYFDELFFLLFDFLSLCFPIVFHLVAECLQTSGPCNICKLHKGSITLPQRQMKEWAKKGNRIACAAARTIAFAKTSMAIKLMFEFVNINLWIIEMVLSATSNNIFA